MHLVPTPDCRLDDSEPAAQVLAVSPCVVPALWIMRLLGMMSAAHSVIRLGLLNIRSLQSWFSRLNLHPVQDPRRLVKVYPRALRDVRLWNSASNLHRTVSLDCQNTSLQVFTDASLSGWGGHLDQICVSGICSSSEGRQINLLELLEVLVALSPYLSGNHVMTMWHQKNYLGDHSQMNGVYLRRWQTWSKVSDADQRPLGVPSIEVSASASIRNPEGSPNNRTTPQGLASPGLTISHLPTDVQLTLQNAKAPSTLRGYNAQWTFFSR
ncbi:uncharacterized protein LOC128748897 isoform X2 [Synchiropus splendidus]|uniref:uncharacterized protein LOC128748897 isoform X2 n=1 Tax=Synchiropus splendidus TaxID=270530 RepID=UPI00237EE1A4|nr:uncharacterized protein LOC128748897 isoform X2 [Synchiropus splendidus]